MPDRDSDEDLSRLVAELVTALRDLEEEVEPPEGPPGPSGPPRPRLPTPQELRRFTSDVAIPGIILVLETNIRALRLLQRALEVSERAERTRDEARLGERARSVSDTTLDKLDDALADLEGAIEARPDNDEAARLLDDARSLRAEVQTRLAEYAEDANRRARSEWSDESGAGVADDETVAGGDDSSETADESSTGDATDEPSGPQVDVDAELESIKAELDDRENGAPGNGADAADESTGTDSTDDAADAPDEGPDADASDDSPGSGGTDDPAAGDPTDDSPESDGS